MVVLEVGAGSDERGTPVTSSFEPRAELFPGLCPDNRNGQRTVDLPYREKVRLSAAGHTTLQRATRLGDGLATKTAQHLRHRAWYICDVANMRRAQYRTRQQ